MQRSARRPALLVLAFVTVAALLAPATPADAQGRRRPGRAPRASAVEAEPAPAPPSAAGAAQAEAGSDADEEARRLFLAGEEAYDGGRYEEALASFSRAYALSGRPGLLFNIGSVSERLRRDREALRSYQAYLQAEPEAANREFVERRIAFLSEQIGVVERREREVTEALDAASPAAEPQVALAPAPRTRAADALDGPASIAPGALSADGELARDEGGGSGDAWWVWALAGAVAVAAGVGIAVAVGASSGNEPAPPVRGDFGPGGVVIALEGL
jgi:tetratricopeptide (TPR) repeat protein